jgi:hypothetical protein
VPGKKVKLKNTDMEQGSALATTALIQLMYDRGVTSFTVTRRRFDTMAAMRGTSILKIEPGIDDDTYIVSLQYEGSA